MMAGILIFAILNLAMLDSAILVFPFIFTHTCRDWLPLFAEKKFHSFSLTVIDDGSHLEFCHVGFRHCHLGFRHLVIFSQIHSKTLSFHSDIWLKLIQLDPNSFILTLLDDGSHLQICHLEIDHLGFSHDSNSSQSHSHLIRLVPAICTKNFTHSFWLNLMMAAILNYTLLNLGMVEVAILQKTLTQTNLIWLKLIHSHWTWWWQPSWILPSWIWPCWIQTSYYFLSKSLTLAKVGSHHLHKKTSLIHSDSTWWWQPSWILPCWIQTLPSWIQTPCYLLSESLKNTLAPLWLWLKLIQSDSNSFILTHLEDGSHLGFSHLSISSQTH